MSDTSLEQNLERYGLDRWGDGFFTVGQAGTVEVLPGRTGERPIDLLALVEQLRERGMRTPLLVRFSDILAQRIEEVNDAFAGAIDQFGFRGRYRGVYPIKVNQQRHVVEELLHHGGAHDIGLEAGSKPELLIALALHDADDALIICNGYKDRAYIETALLAQKLGSKPVIVIDRVHEVEILIKECHQLGIRPHIGIRGKPSTAGAGKWTDSTGLRSKFGLSPSEIVDVADRLHGEGLLDCVELIHFHIGSQITQIRAHKEALREISRLYVGLRQMGASNLHMVDVGGGLGVDYDGTRSDSNSSMNYSLQEYANDVVSAIHETCQETREPHPDIVSESGRALVAHHSVLIFDVLGTNKLRSEIAPARRGSDDARITRDFERVIANLEDGHVQEAYHDALQIRDEVNSLFGLGYLSLRQRAEADRHFLHCCERIVVAARALPQIPEDLAALENDLADTYFGNFSVFQSAPDHWAVKQLFPIMPIHRLDEAPTRRGVFADLTCDSDGKIDRFISLHGEAGAMDLHELNGEPYYVGVFLVGAYQEILGDLHNLFGDTDAVHVSLDEDGYSIEHVVDGDEVAEVLRYVQYEPAGLVERVRRASERALRRGEITLGESARLRKHFEEGLRGYTYLSNG